MLRRLMMFILVACLAVPAAAMPVAYEAAAPPMAGHCDEMQVEPMEHRTPKGDIAGGHHGCIGCIPPVDGIAAVGTHALLHIDLPLSWAVLPLSGGMIRPDIPPPRRV